MSIAQSTAITVQDATDNLRNLNTITTTAIAVALAQLLATGDAKYSKVIEESQKVVAKGAENMLSVGEKAAAVLKEFTSIK